MSISKMADYAIMGGIAISGLAGMGTAGTVFNGANEARESIRENNAQVMQLQDALQHQAAMAEIANQRYQTGLVIVVSQDQQNLVALQAGREVVDSATGHPLPDGVVVGDHLGNTGIIQDGVVSMMAFTGNRELVNHAIASMSTRFDTAFTQQGGSNE